MTKQAERNEAPPQTLSKAIEGAEQIPGEDDFCLPTSPVAGEDFDSSRSLHHVADIRSRFNEYLSTDWIGPKGTYFETIQHPINPGLHILNAETVGLPLSHREANTIIDISVDLELPEQDEGGRNKLRTAFTILPKAMRFDNPAFKAWLREVSLKVNTGLSIAGKPPWEGIRVTFHGLVLQPPSPGDEPYKINVETDKAFGNMVIVLPTIHTGGTITLTTKTPDTNNIVPDSVLKYDTFETSAFGCSVIAWLNSDKEVELGAIESGCRVILVYNLVSAEKIHFPSVAVTHSMEKLLRKALVDLKEYPEASGKISGVFGHILKHTRQIHDPVLESLHPHDRNIVEVLKKICEQTGTLFYLANIEATATKTPGTNNIVPDSVSLTQVSDLDCTRMAYYVKIEKENLIQDLTGWKKENNEYGEDVLTYHGAAALMVVPSCYPSLLLNPENEGRADAYRWLDQAIQVVKASGDHIAREQLRHSCRYITREFVAYQDGTKEYAEQPFDKNVMELVVKASLITGELDLSFNIENLTWETHFGIGQFIAVHGFPPIETSLALGIAKLPHIYSRCQVLNELETNVAAASEVEDPITKNLMAAWREKQTIEALRDCTFETSDDAICLVHTAGRYGSHFMLTSIMDTMRKHIKCTSFIVHFLNHLAASNRLQNLPEDAVRTSYRVLLPEIMSSLWLRRRPQTQKRSIARRRTLSHPAAPNPSQVATGEQISLLLSNCLEFGLEAQLSTLVQHFLDEGSSRKATDSADDFEKFYLPFLSHLYGLVKELQSWKAKRWEYRHIVPKYLQNPHIRRLFRKMIKNHLKQLHSPDPPLPPHPTDWVKSKKGCSSVVCRDCRKLDRFLHDATKKQEEFRVHTQRRRHLEERFGDLSMLPNSQGYTARSTIDPEYRFKYLTDPYPGVLIIEKSHQDFEDKINAWSFKCSHHLRLIDANLVRTGAADMLGDCMGMMKDLREMVNLKVLISEAHLELCAKELQSHFA